MRKDFRTAGPDEENRNIVILVKRLAIQFDRQTNPEFAPVLGTAAEKLTAEGFTGAEGLASRIMEHRREAGMQEG